MNPTVRLREAGTTNVYTYTLVYPQYASTADGRLSVLARVGTAILGCRAGDVVSWHGPGGLIQFQIEELIYQSEREGVLA